MKLLALRTTGSGGTFLDGENAQMVEGYENCVPASLDFSVWIASGRGTAKVTIRALPKDFEQIAQAMMNVDAAAATKAFGAALVAGNKAELHPLLRE